MPITNNKLIEEKWRNIVGYLRSDLAHIWTEEAKAEFERLQNKGERIIFLLRKLLGYYKKHPLKNRKKISELNSLISTIQNSSNELESLIRGRLFGNLFDQEQREFFESRLQEIKARSIGIQEQAAASDLSVDLQPVKVGRKRVWTIARRKPEFFARLRRGTRRLLISSMLAVTLGGFIPAKAGSSFVRQKTDIEVVKQLLPEATDEEIKAMVNASRFIDQLTDLINKNKSNDIKNEDLPDYVKELISDGVLDIAYFAGVEVTAGELRHPIAESAARTVTIGQRKIALHIRYITAREDAIKAFEESDVIYINSHSRYGLGWALREEGMGNPLRMQTYPIKIPRDELHGYSGRILKELPGDTIIVQASDEDIKKIRPRKGYQLIAMNTCYSGAYFLDIIKRLRQGLPTTVIYTTAEIYGTTTGFYAFLQDIFSGKNIEQIAQALNEIQIAKYKRLNVKLPTTSFFEAVVLNAPAGSPESTQYDRFNTPNSFTLFYDIER